MGSNPTLTAILISSCMNYARIMTVGHRRFGEAMISIALSDRIVPQPEITYIISPYSRSKMRDFLAPAKLDLINYKFIQEQEFDRYRPMLPWYRETHHWFYQQALKLSALDILPHDAFMLQDCDCTTVGTYEPWRNGRANVRVETIKANPYIAIYDNMITKFLGIRKHNPEITYTSELVPIKKVSWIALRERIESLHGKDFLTAIAEFYQISQDSERTLSEFEMLGTWQEFHDECLHELQEECTEHDPDRLRTSDFDDISEFTVLKFRASPMKYITQDAAVDIIKNIRRYIDNRKIK